MHLTRLLAATAAFLCVGVGGAGAAMAAGPEPWQLGFRPPASTSMQSVHDFNDFLVIVVVLITAFVLGLLCYVMWRFSAARNPVPSKTSHNTVLEMLWTVIPVIILVAIAIPSFKQLYFMDRIQDSEFTLKAIGHQWYWSYEYPDHDDLTFDSFLVEEEDLEEGGVRLLETDNPVVLPVDTDIRLLITADDVLHSWSVPAFAITMDAVPGRVNETWVRITREGTYYGQCSELCGVGHGFMPITVKAVSKDAFAAWLEEAKEEYVRADEAADVAWASRRDAR